MKVSPVKFSRREFLAGAAALAAVSALPAAALALEGSRPKYVILVDWDGFDRKYLGRVPTPNLDALASRGSLSFADGTFHTFSNPSRASMATGRIPRCTATQLISSTRAPTRQWARIGS